MEFFFSLSIYLIAFSSSIFFAIIYQQKFNNLVSSKNLIYYFKKTLWLILIVFPPIFISTIRFGVGTDYFNYIDIYNRVNFLWSNSMSFNYYKHEALFYYLMRLSDFLFSSNIGMFFFSSLLIHLFLFLGLDYFKKDISMAFGFFIYYFYLFNFSLNGIRQTIAFSIIFFALRYIIEKKLFKYLFWVFIAVLFHNTALVALFFYFLVYYKSKIYTQSRRIIYYISIILTPFVLFFSFNFLFKIPIISQYSHYLTANSLEIEFGFLIHILPILLPVFIFRKSIIHLNKRYQSLIDLSLLNIPFQYLGYYSKWGGRIALYTNVIYFVLIPLTLNSLKKKNNKLGCIINVVKKKM